MDPQLHDNHLGRAGSGKNQESREGEIEHFIGPIPLSSEPLHLSPPGGTKDKSSDEALATLKLGGQHWISKVLII